MNDNPFSALLSGAPSSTDPDENSAYATKINNAIEDVFLMTLNKDVVRRGAPAGGPVPQLILMEKLAEGRSKLDLETLEHALFERLLKENLQPNEQLVLTKCDRDAGEGEVLTYLSACHRRLQPYLKGNDQALRDAAAKMRGLVLRNAVTAIQEPEVFDKQSLSNQLYNMIISENDCQTFVHDVVTHFMSEEHPAETKIKNIFDPVLKLLHKDILKATVVTLDLYVFPALSVFATHPKLAYLMIEYCEPYAPESGRAYQNTLIGGLLSLSVLPRYPMEKYEFFDNPLDRVESATLQEVIWKGTEYLVTNLHMLFMQLLKVSPEIKDRLLTWLGNCLNTNAGRGKMWTSASSSRSCVPDGFMLNLSLVFLMLSQPFCNEKCLKVDPGYCAVKESDCRAKNVHMKTTDNETCLIPLRSVPSDPSASRRFTNSTFNFVTECFFMTHRALNLGYRIIVEKFLKVTQELGHLRQTFGDTAGHSPGDLTEILDKRIKLYTKKILSLRCALCEPQTVMLLSNFHSTTCDWLIQLAINHPGEGKAFLSTEFRPLKFPLRTNEPDVLRYVPEYVVENIFDFMSMNKTLQQFPHHGQTANLMEPLLTLVLVFMGDSKKMRNPHLRARLAECLALMIPHNESDDLPMSDFEMAARERLFATHPHRLQIAQSLLNVFVGIEVTGEGVSFEQKFHYRRPMYLVLDYLWELEEHRECLKRMSEEAEAEMEAVSPPLFLRFINLLINDAIFLLDESLTNMTQIRTMESISEAELAQRPSQERGEHYMNLRHTGMIARFDNILGRHTINTLQKITKEIKSIFCHLTMVDRIASMLNYFLMHLVGPNRKNFKVKDSKEYEFEPAMTVLSIVRIYINLGENKQFCLAVSNDGRSYSPKLFQLAEDVLARIHGDPDLISSLRLFAERVAGLAAQQLEDEEVFADAPDEFLDPIMSTVMLDPVTLPSSKMNIDRTTIARHLLSDQSDPFNRSRLNMDQVKPNPELKSKINEWVERRRNEYRMKNQSPEKK